MYSIRNLQRPCPIKLKRGKPGHISSWIGGTHRHQNGIPAGSRFSDSQHSFQFRISSPETTEYRIQVVRIMTPQACILSVAGCRHCKRDELHNSRFDSSRLRDHPCNTDQQCCQTILANYFRHCPQVLWCWRYPESLAGFINLAIDFWKA